VNPCHTSQAAARSSMEVDEGPAGVSAAVGDTGACHNYVVTAHKPTAVTHAVVGNFTSPTDVNLIVAYVCLLGPRGMHLGGRRTPLTAARMVAACRHHYHAPMVPCSARTVCVPPFAPHRCHTRIEIYTLVQSGLQVWRALRARRALVHWLTAQSYGDTLPHACSETRCQLAGTPPPLHTALCKLHAPCAGLVPACSGMVRAAWPRHE
jgi:hypothetical protein